MPGANARFQAHFKNQQSTIKNQQSLIINPLRILLGLRPASLDINAPSFTKQAGTPFSKTGCKPILLRDSLCDLRIFAFRYDPNLLKHRLPYRSGNRFSRGLRLPGWAGGGRVAGVMTRQSIELAIYVFLVSLVCTFTWAFYQLMVLVGWW
ncbi:MAG: hypothetical protein K9N23_00090 [Akkermansiaceae bacterium]|nr:hypothetical protein [Akkermansiaceae bacterium]MCF7730048.1 hypothetical protein [Akkermansiaceae bacterium]